MMKNAFWAVFAVSLLVVIAGCGPQSDLPELGTVSGVVTMDGEPLAGVSVKFVPANGRTSSATTDGSGRYELTYTREVKGAEVGEHTVYITSQGSEGGGNPNEETGGDGPTVEFFTGTIPAKYNENTELKETVTAGSNTCDFKLESK